MGTFQDPESGRTYDFPELLELTSSGSFPGAKVRNVDTGALYQASSIPDFHICRNCGHLDHQGHRYKMSGCVLLALLFFFIVPGIIYAVWGATAGGVVFCKNCHAEGATIPVTSPEGRKLIEA